jgi:hypothetical protein
MPATTGGEIVRGAFALLNVFLPGEPVNANDGEYARTVLNDWLSEQAQKALMIPTISREVFDLTANKGGPSNPYTIGTGGNFNTTKPANQNSLAGATLLLTASDPDAEVPLAIYTDDMYQQVQIKELTSAQPTGVYYNPTYATSGLGTINLWPVPDNATNDLVLYLQKALSQFANLTTTYYVPDGVPRMLKSNLADALQGTYGRQLSESDRRMAVSSLGTFKRSNTKLSDLVNDAYLFTYPRLSLYNINSGNG